MTKSLCPFFLESFKVQNKLVIEPKENAEEQKDDAQRFSSPKEKTVRNQTPPDKNVSENPLPTGNDSQHGFAHPISVPMPPTSNSQSANLSSDLYGSYLPQNHQPNLHQNFHHNLQGSHMYYSQTYPSTGMVSFKCTWNSLSLKYFRVVLVTVEWKLILP